MSVLRSYAFDIQQITHGVLASLALLSALVGTAHAEPDSQLSAGVFVAKRHPFVGGLDLGFARTTHRGAHVERAWHVSMQLGSAGGSPVPEAIGSEGPERPYLAALGGFESRACTAGRWVCAFASIDAFVDGGLGDARERFASVGLEPRVGWNVGGAHWRGSISWGLLGGTRIFKDEAYVGVSGYMSIARRF